MAYATHGCYEVQMLKGTGERLVDLSSTGDKALWGPMFVPHIVHAMAVSPNATPGDAGVLKLDLRPTTGSDTNRTDGTVATINLATSHTVTAGTISKVIYHQVSSPVTVYPGQELVAEMTDASASVTAAAITLWVEPVYEAPGNIVGLSTSSTMVATT